MGDGLYVIVFITVIVNVSVFAAVATYTDDYDDDYDEGYDDDDAPSMVVLFFSHCFDPHSHPFPTKARYKMFLKSIH